MFLSFLSRAPKFPLPLPLSTPATQAKSKAMLLAVEEVIENLGLKHPIIFDVYNLCQYYHSNKLASFSVELNMRMISWALQLHYFTRNKQKIML